jgi:hypothetical protein
VIAIALVALAFAAIILVFIACEQGREMHKLRARATAAEEDALQLAIPRAVPSGRATVLDADKFTRIWRNTAPETELFLAVQQLLALETVAAIDDATNPALADRPGSLAAAQAQVNALLSFAATLDEARLTPEKWAPQKARG